MAFDGVETFLRSGLRSGFRPSLRSGRGKKETRAQAEIRRARVLISDPACWVQGAYQEGGAMCIVGALRMVHFGDAEANAFSPAERYVLEAVEAATAVDDIEVFNDLHATHADALAMLDLAYELAAKALVEAE